MRRKYTTIFTMADSCGHSPAPAPSTNKSRRKAMCVKFHEEPPVLDTPEGPPRSCWYGRRPPDIPPDVGGVHTIEDGRLLFCAHTMWFPVGGYQFDVRNCAGCDCFKPVRSAPL